MRTKQLALLAGQAIEDKKGVDVLILDVKKLSAVVDYFVIGSGTSDRHVKALADNVIDELDKKDEPVIHSQGLSDCRWVLLDYGDVMIHLFHPEMRDFYGLERLWGEGKLIDAKSLKTQK